jgi:hypothetical protein
MARGSLEGRFGRVRRLEEASQLSAQSITRAALEVLSDEDLDILEDVLEAAELGEDPRATERGRSVLAAYSNAVEAVKRGEVRKKPEKGAEQ